MFSIQSLVQVARRWLRRTGPAKVARRAGPALERLDHRQLLSVNFTGNAIIDIPDTGQPGTVILQDNGTVTKPIIPPDLQPLIRVSGLELNGIRMRYTPEDDILSVGLQQPDNQKTGQFVLAGDTDNNGDGGTVAPAVLALRPEFIDAAFLGGAETMGAFLDLNNDAIPDVVAGIANAANTASGLPLSKLYQVADAEVNPDPVIAASTAPRFGAMRLVNTGASFLTNDPDRPNLEFQVTGFSQLYQEKTGTPLRTDSIIRVGAFANSLTDDGISEAFFPAQNANFGVVPPVPPQPPVCPPAEPPIKINPHEDNHINTAHPTDVRVYVFGTERFKVNRIIPSTVRLGGAAPIASFNRNSNGDRFPDKTFVFRGSDIDLPRGVTKATVTGTLTDGTTFQSVEKVFNRNESFFTPQQIAARDRRQARAGFDAENPPKTPFQLGLVGSRPRAERVEAAAAHDLALEQTLGGDATPFERKGRPTVAIPTRAGGKGANAKDDGTRTGARLGASAHAGHQPAAPLTVTIPRRPVAQVGAPVKVSGPRRNTVVIDDGSSRSGASHTSASHGLARSGMGSVARPRSRMA